MFINEQIEKGNLSPDLPGLEIERVGDNVKLNFGTVVRTFNRDMAKSYAATLKAITTPMLTPSKDNPFLPTPELEILKRGTSVKLIDRNTGAEKTMAHSIARDLAENLIKAAS